MSVPGADGDVEVGHRARPREARVHVDDGGAAALGLHHPAEGHRVALRHVRALHRRSQSAFWQIRLGRSWRRRGRTRSPDRGPWSCVRSAPGSPPARCRGRGVELLDEVVLLVVERRAAEVGDAERAPHPRAVVLRVRVLDALLARLVAASASDALGHHVHRLLERDPLPGRCRPAGGRAPAARRCEPVTSWNVAAPFGQRQPCEMGESGSPSMSMIRLVLHVHELAAADRAVRADRADDAIRRGACAARARASARSSRSRPDPRCRRRRAGARPAIPRRREAWASGRPPMRHGGSRSEGKRRRRSRRCRGAACSRRRQAGG